RHRAREHLARVQDAARGSARVDRAAPRRARYDDDRRAAAARHDARARSAASHVVDRQPARERTYRVRAARDPAAERRPRRRRRRGHRARRTAARAARPEARGRESRGLAYAPGRPPAVDAGARELARECGQVRAGRPVRIGGEAAGGGGLWGEDGGGGPLEPDTSRLFEQFTRSGGEDPDESGLGLGLYIVQSIVERHGGRVTLGRTSEARTRVRVELPLGDRMRVLRAADAPERSSDTGLRATGSGDS